MRKRRWRRRIVIGLMLLLLAAGTGWYILLPGIIQHIVKKELAEAGWVLDQEPDVRLAPGRVTILNISVSEPQLLSIQSVQADWTPSSLLRRRLTDIRIRGVQILAAPGDGEEQDPWSPVGAVLGASLGPMPFRSVEMTDARLRIDMPQSTIPIDVTASVRPDGRGGLEARARAEAEAVVVELRGRTAAGHRIERIEVGVDVQSAAGLNALLAALELEPVMLDSGSGAARIAISPSGNGWWIDLQARGRSLRSMANAAGAEAAGAEAAGAEAAGAEVAVGDAALIGRASLGIDGDLGEATIGCTAGRLRVAGSRWASARADIRKEGRDARVALRLLPEDSHPDAGPPMPGPELQEPGGIAAAGGEGGEKGEAGSALPAGEDDSSRAEEVALRIEDVFTAEGHPGLPEEELVLREIGLRIERLLPARSGLDRLRIEEGGAVLRPPQGGWRAVPELFAADPVDTAGRIVSEARIGSGHVRGPVAGTLRDIAFSGTYRRTGEMAGEVSVIATLPGGEVRTTSRVDAPAGIVRFSIDSDAIDLARASGWLPAFPGFESVELAGTAGMGLELALGAEGWKGRLALDGDDLEGAIRPGAEASLDFAGRALRVEADFTAARDMTVDAIQMTVSAEDAAVLLPGGTRIRGASLGARLSAESPARDGAVRLEVRGERAEVRLGESPLPPPELLRVELGETAAPGASSDVVESGESSQATDLDLGGLTLRLEARLRGRGEIASLQTALDAEGMRLLGQRIDRVALRLLQETETGYIEASGEGQGWALSRLEGELLGLRPWIDHVVALSGLPQALAGGGGQPNASALPRSPVRARGLAVSGSVAGLADLDVQLDAELSFGEETSLLLQARNGSVSSTELAIEGRGLYGSLLLNGFDPVRTPPGQRVGIDEFTLGVITLRDCWTTFGIERLPLSREAPASIHVERIEWEWGEGRIRSTDFRVDPWGERMPLALVIEELRLEDFLRLIGRESVAGTGILSGDIRIGIPLRDVDAARIPVRGRLATTGPGTLNLTGVALDYVRDNLPEIPIPTDTAGGTEDVSKRIVNSLKDFAYQELWVAFEENESGGTRASIFLSGEGRNLDRPIPIGGWTVNVNDFDELLKLRTFLYDTGGEFETNLKGLF